MNWHKAFDHQLGTLTKFCFTFVYGLHPRNLTWNLKIMVSKRTFLFQGLIFRFHVKFWGCMVILKKSLFLIGESWHIASMAISWSRCGGLDDVECVSGTQCEPSGTKSCVVYGLSNTLKHFHDSSVGKICSSQVVILLMGEILHQLISNTKFIPWISYKLGLYYIDIIYPRWLAGFLLPTVSLQFPMFLCDEFTTQLWRGTLPGNGGQALSAVS